MIEIGKTLILAGDMLSFWLADGQSHEMFDENARSKFSSGLWTQLNRINSSGAADTNDDNKVSDDADVSGLISRVVYHLELIDNKITGRQGRRSEITCRVGTFSGNAYPDQTTSSLLHSRPNCIEWRKKLSDFCTEKNDDFLENDWINRIVGSVATVQQNAIDCNLIKPLASLSQYAEKIVQSSNWKEYEDTSSVAKKLDRDLRHAVSCTSIGQNTIAVLEAASIVSELAYASLQRSKLVFHMKRVSENKRPLWISNLIGQDTSLSNTPVFSTEFRELTASWVQTTILCNHGLRILRKLDPSQHVEGFRMQIKLHTLYGVALANIDRFSEAHRHINEAMALGSKVASSLDEVEVGIVRLRRAEIYMTESVSIFKTMKECDNSEFFQSLFALLEGNQLERCNLPQRVETALLQVRRFLNWREALTSFKGILYRMAVSSFDDAWSMLEDAENGFAGRNRSSYWWGRLYTLQLRAFSMADSIKHELLPLRSPTYGNNIEKEQNPAKPRLLIERKTTQFDARRLDVYKKGRLTSGSRIFRSLRLADYMLGSEESLSSMVSGRELRSIWTDWIAIVKNDLIATERQLPKSLKDYHSQLIQRCDRMKQLIN